ncbi:hypothetical protein Q7C_38 [Methylophaga frappieri]|uniref:Dual-action ribosomal maturation protein DarP n=1 Tax=Methylophaga frappieri (strain ATCC BAA-2434 / DSM 25690 / JAM7) TaxID=754477 RepID=I1YE80_METFJ|nr:ribosome biogenesis factor YjgA [Methylophaga frappieri]AFJ01223.1 hypothetical protein Q7C_38 [Methylophaga frappieri]
MAHDDDWASFSEDTDKSKSQLKREMLACRELGQHLIQLPESDLKKLDIDADLLEAVLDAQKMQKGALKRQTGFIGGLIADNDPETIRVQIQQLGQPHRQETAVFHQLENWRDRLIANDDKVMQEIFTKFPLFDSQHARQLVRNANREAEKNQPPKSARLLFQYLKQLRTD